MSDYGDSILEMNELARKARHTKEVFVTESQCEDIEALENENKHLRDERDQLKTENGKLREALEKIKNGGVSNGVLASAETRMHTMCEIAYQALLADKRD